MLDMGFLPSIKRIMSVIPAERQTMFFSATIESSVKKLVETHVRNPVRIELGSITKPSEQVDLHFYEVDQDRKLGLLQMMLKDEQGSFLVFARTKHGAEQLAKKLSQSGFKCAAIHGDRSQNQRNQALKGFQDGYYRVLVATDVAARGIHVEGIAHVVNYDLPQVPEDFIHRVGRTGRAGARGTASTFATRSERSEVARIERTLSIKLKRREVSANIPQTPRRDAAPVIVMPPADPFRATPQIVPLLFQIRTTPGSPRSLRSLFQPGGLRSPGLYAVPLLQTGDNSVTNLLARAALWLGWHTSNVKPVGARDFSTVFPSLRCPSNAARMSSAIPTNTHSRAFESP